MSKAKPVAAVVPDAESLALRNNPAFLAILARSQASYEQHGGYSTDEVRRFLGARRQVRKKAALAALAKITRRCSRAGG